MLQKKACPIRISTKYLKLRNEKTRHSEEGKLY